MHRIIRKSILPSMVLAGSIALFAANATPAASHPRPGKSSAAVAPRRSEWQTDYRKALATAGRLKRPLLLNFTGTDWCYWCQMLKEEVFDTPEFIAWARETVVLVEVDFPEYHRQGAGLKKQNRELRRRFSERLEGGFPTVIFLDPGGIRTLGELGYETGEPAAWIDAAKRILAE